MHLLFTDASVDPRLGVGFGAYLYLPHENLSIVPDIQVKRFEATSSTKLELQTLLWALDQISVDAVTVYTDSQNIISLPQRRSKLEKAKYLTNSSKLLKNHLLYKEFYRCYDSRQLQLVKIKGHTAQKDELARIFAQVDKTSRQALRRYLCEKT
ncbi:MAG: RNase H family protein [Spirochaetota bacterium]